MRHVAQRAGVSLKTVSRVINEEARVAPQTAERVTTAIAELGFRRNDLARSLRQGSTSATLGLVIEDLTNPFYSTIAQAVEDASRPRGYMLITGSCEEDGQRERELILPLLLRRARAAASALHPGARSGVAAGQFSFGCSRRAASGARRRQSAWPV